MYQKEKIALRARAKTPGNVEVIYAEPFARPPGRSDPARALPNLNGNIDPPKIASGYQNLLTKNQDNGKNKGEISTRFFTVRGFERNVGRFVKKSFR